MERKSELRTLRQDVVAELARAAASGIIGRKRRAARARISKPVPPAAIRSTEKLEIIS